MSKSEDSGSPGWTASFFMPTKEDVARAVAAAAAAATAVHSPRPSAVYSLKDENSSQFQKLQHHVARVLKGFSQPPEVRRGTYNPEVLTSQKRQWANFQLQHLQVSTEGCNFVYVAVILIQHFSIVNERNDHRSFKGPSRLFESMVVVGLPPSCDIQALQRQYVTRQSEGSGKLRSALSCQNNSRVEPYLEPQVGVLHKTSDSLYLEGHFGGGIGVGIMSLDIDFVLYFQVHAVEKTPSMSELNEILLSQVFLLKSDVNALQLENLDDRLSRAVADNSTLYGCCVLVEEIVQKPSGLLSLISDRQPAYPSLSRYVMTTRRCYCILSRLPFFELHFGVLNSIFDEERLERLTKSIGDIDLELSESYSNEANIDDVLTDQGALEDMQNTMTEPSEI
ncbi:hypothetical protein Gogos_007445, partial [Gossypium gossypioides]|nr:hypothetical protein [Gossypium gossypioides]